VGFWLSGLAGWVSFLGRGIGKIQWRDCTTEEYDVVCTVVWTEYVERGERLGHSLTTFLLVSLGREIRC
jgi:hypothetical protein